VFCASLTDVFDNQADSAWRQDFFASIRECRRLDWLLLTKRSQNIAKMLPSDWGDGYRNVWLGITPRIKRDWISLGLAFKRYPP
jgi:protein gp37